MNSLGSNFRPLVHQTARRAVWWMLFVLFVGGAGFSQITIDTSKLRSAGPQFLSVTGLLSVNYGADVQGILVAVRRGNEVLERLSLPTEGEVRGEVEVGVYLTPTLTFCEDAPTLFLYGRLLDSGGSEMREGTSGSCYPLGEGVRLASERLRGRVQEVRAGQWYAMKAIRLEPDTAFDALDSADGFLVFYVFFSDQAVPQDEAAWPDVPEVQTIRDIEAMAVDVPSVPDE